MKKQPSCTECFAELDYHEERDAYFCKKCDEWFEKVCGDPKCYHCYLRADKPSQEQNDI